MSRAAHARPAAESTTARRPRGRRCAHPGVRRAPPLLAFAASGEARDGHLVTAAVETADHGRLRYVPGLDGLRGLAVLAVLVYHQGTGWARGGFLGVSLFFTLSGFLITTLVVREHAATGRLDLRRFWSRRVRRLAPAALLGIGLALVALVVAVPRAQWGAGVADVRAALVQLANWRFVLADAPYVDASTVPSPVLHYWSLAIEEQFYLVLPVVALVALRRGRRTLAAVLGAVTVASFAAQVALPASDRVYFGTDTRAAELAIGGLLALAWPWLRDRVRSARTFDVVGVAALAVTLGLWATVAQSSRWLLDGGLTLVALLSVGVLVGVLGGSAVPAALSWRPLRALGMVSYGLYVVHFPVFLLLTPARVGLDGAALFAVRVAVSLAIAVPSLLLVERPLRHGQPLPVLGWTWRGWRGAIAALAGLALLAAATVPLAQRVPAPTVVATGMVPATVPPLAGVDDADGTDDGTDAEVEDDADGTDDADGAEGADGAALDGLAADGTDTAPDGDDLDGTNTEDGAPGDDAGGPAPDASPVRDDDGASAPAAPTSRPPRLVVVGDSTAQALGEGLQAWATRTGQLQVSVVSSPGCAVHAGEVARYRPGFEFTPSGCDRLFPTAVDEVARTDADALVVLLGSPQLADWRFPGRATWTDLRDRGFQDDYVARLRTTLDTTLAAVAGASPVPILWADVPVPQWDLASFGTLIGGEPPGIGPPVINDPARTEILNRRTAQVLDAVPGATGIAYVAGLAGPDGVVERADREDGLHLSRAQVERAADTWLLPAIEAAFVDALRELGHQPDAEVVWPRTGGA
ncbi:acyltransferase [Nitriliruptoraceae bacterium ZYF776]|nr:acyltransferase [Profundirhabdus halotolerans]